MVPPTLTLWAAKLWIREADFNLLRVPPPVRLGQNCALLTTVLLHRKI